MLETQIDFKDVQIEEIFEVFKEQQVKVGLTTAKERIKKLRCLLASIYEHKQEIRDALYNDFKKPSAEVDLTEIYVLISELKYTIKNLKEWMAIKPVSTPLPMLGSNSYIQYESKGVCLIISPWNFPFQLALGPLITAVAAGNSVIIKPSENTPYTSALINKIVSKVFAPDEVRVLEGGIPLTTKLLSLPFNHIFFTGSPQVGKIVMRAAAEHLASVTLELGGKSPNIIDETANLNIAAKRTAWGKFLNNGQICLAPDYVLVHENVKDEFVNKAKEYIIKYYGDNPQSSAAYARMVNSNHYNRVKSYVDDAVSKGGRILIGGVTQDTEKYISPTLIDNVALDSNLMVDEIFGPVLPIVTFKNIDEAIKLINSKERPLGLYIYSKNKKNINKIMSQTRAGGTSINHNNVHFLNHYLPFGGVNNSGIGKAHGWYGFEAFSNARSVLKQNMPGALDLLMPPYTKLKQKLIDFTLKYM